MDDNESGAIFDCQYLCWLFEKIVCMCIRIPVRDVFRVWCLKKSELLVNFSCVDDSCLMLFVCVSLPLVPLVVDLRLTGVVFHDLLYWSSTSPHVVSLDLRSKHNDILVNKF